MKRSRCRAVAANVGSRLALLVCVAACGGMADGPVVRRLAPVIEPAAMSTASDRQLALACSSRLQRAQAGFPHRRHVLVQRFLADLVRDGLGDFARDPRSDSFRRMAAGLYALGEARARANDTAAATEAYAPAAPEDLPKQVEAFARSLHAFRPGTVGGLSRQNGDYDFLMKEMISLLYRFRERPDLLTDDAAFFIVDRALAPLAGVDIDERLSFRVSVPLLGALLSYPETENHVLMTLSSIYLTNQWIVENPRHDPRLRSGAYRDLRRFQNRGSALEDRVLQAAGRVLHNGFWEVNGRPYQSMTAHALINLSSFAAGESVRAAARNALDLLSAQFAFQSLEMKRLGPYRRSTQNVSTAGIYDNDGVIFMLGALAGGYAWPDDFFGSGNAAGHALWAALLDYRVPAAVHELMLDKHTGFWARMQSRFGDDDYAYGKPGRYFSSAHDAFARGQPQFLQELYFVTPSFMNVAGGRFTRYRIFGDLLIGEHGVHDLDFLSRPHAILPRGHLEQWSGLSQMAEQVLIMPGEAQFWRSDNSATYKSFSYGYFHDGDRDRHLDFPMRIPESLRSQLYREDGRAVFATRPVSRVAFAFLDLSKLERYGFYVVLGHVGKSENSERHRYYARGFWEVVPAARFSSVRALKEQVLQRNRAAAFGNATEGPQRYYRYRMTNGETLELDDRLGFAQERCENPIRRVWAAGAEPGRDAPERLSDVLFDRCDPDAIARTPLLDVREVDAQFQLTGRRLAYASGNGRVWVDNPYLGARLELDSTDYRRPSRREQLR